MATSIHIGLLGLQTILICEMGYGKAARVKEQEHPHATPWCIDGHSSPESKDATTSTVVNHEACHKWDKHVQPKLGYLLHSKLQVVVFNVGVVVREQPFRNSYKRRNNILLGQFHLWNLLDAKWGKERYPLRTLHNTANLEAKPMSFYRS